jgi:predicted porin
MVIVPPRISPTHQKFIHGDKTMKQKLLPALITATIAATAITGAAPAFAGFPTVYGKVNLSLHKYDLERLAFPAGALGGAAADDVDNWSLESNNSRIGVKGDFDISGGLKAIYKLEYGIDVDNGTNSNGREFTTRNVYGGLQGSWGTLIAGKNDTPLKLIQTNTVTQSDIDRFNDAPLADINSYLVGENRADNVIIYSSPIFLGGFEFSLAAAQIEENGTSSTTDDNGFASGKSAALSYGRSTWYTAIAYDDNILNTDALRIVGEVVLGPVKLGAIYQTAEKHDDVDTLGGLTTSIGSAQGSGVGNPVNEWDGTTVASSFAEQDGYVLNAAWKVAGPWTLKAQFAQVETTPQRQPLTTGVQYDDVEVDAYALGLDYKLNDNAKLFAYYATIEASGDTRISADSTEDSTFAVGVDLKF